MGIRALINEFLAGFSYYHRMDKPLSAPSIYAVEITNYCNLNCVMCPVDAMTRKRGYMEFSLFKKIIDETKDYLGTLYLHNFGEPLLHPRLGEMIEYCKKNNVDVGLATNATLLDSKMAETILDSGLDQLILSFDGTSKETYEKLRRGAQYEKTENNITSFLKMKKERGLSKPFTLLQIIRMIETESEIKDFCRHWKSMENPPDEIWVKYFDTFANQVQGIKELSKPEHRYMPTIEKRYPCSYLWYHMVVLWDGTVVPCPKDFDGKLVLGNVKEETLSKIWNREKMKELRARHLKDDYTMDPCIECAEWPGGPHKHLYPLNMDFIKKSLKRAWKAFA